MLSGYGSQVLIPFYQHALDQDQVPSRGWTDAQNSPVPSKDVETAASSAVPGEIASMRFTGDTIAVFVCAVGAVGVAISVVGLIGCEIIALLTRRH